MTPLLLRCPRASAPLLAAVALCTAACGSGPADAGRPEGGVQNVMVTHPAAPPIAPATECAVTVADAPAPGYNHVDTCSDVVYETNPPTGGPHYAIWADYRTYDMPVPWGYLVHDLEHGGVVLTYNCPSGCPDVLSAYQSIITAHGADPACPDGGARFIVVPDPTLDVPVAAVSWEHLYKATCLDMPSLQTFVESHYAHGREDTCAPGVDYSDAGWCPPPG